MGAVFVREHPAPIQFMSEQLPSHLLSERTSVEERGLFTRFGLRAIKPESSHLPALALRFGPLKKADVPEVNAFSAIAETTK